MPVVLVVLTCTALYHALKEWEKNKAAPPQKPETIESSGRKREEWEYYFNRLNDGGLFSQMVTATAIFLHSPEIYTQLMNTWNGLPPRYWEKVLATVRASLNGLILRDAGVSNAPAEAIDTRGISYNRTAMEALLEEPEIDQPRVTGIDIPAASEVYFDAENGIGDDENCEEVGVVATGGVEAEGRGMEAEDMEGRGAEVDGVDEVGDIESSEGDDSEGSGDSAGEESSEGGEEGSGDEDSNEEEEDDAA